MTYSIGEEEEDVREERVAGGDGAESPFVTLFVCIEGRKRCLRPGFCSDSFVFALFERCDAIADGTVGS